MEDLGAELAAAVDGLTYPSESDEPFDVIDWPAGEGDAVVQVKRQTGRDGMGRPVDELFAVLAKTDDSARFETLRALMARTLSDLAVVRVAQGVNVDVYVLGRTPAGGWAGVHSVSVET